MTGTMPLFEAYPALEERLPHRRLATLPTPLEPMSRLAELTGAHRLWIKRDDQSGKLYGGNKVRKLEFLLGDALERGCGEVMTFGVAGSNHVLATGLYARELGVAAIACVTPQTNSHYVARNLQAGVAAGIEYLDFPSQRAADEGARRRSLRSLLCRAREPYTIRMGGSSPLGTVGFVNAALELARQFENTASAFPDRIYLPLGTMGTAVGLAIGLRALALPTRVIGVRVVDERIGNAEACSRLYDATVELLRQNDPRFPRLDARDAGIEIRHEFYGERYAVFTEAGTAAKRIFEDTEGVHLEGTYTAKAAAALLDDIARTGAARENLLFWNTYNSRPLPAGAGDFDFRRLPEALRYYFEAPVQPLDRDGPPAV